MSVATAKQLIDYLQQLPPDAPVAVGTFNNAWVGEPLPLRFVSKELAVQTQAFERALYLDLGQE